MRTEADITFISGSPRPATDKVGLLRNLKGAGVHVDVLGPL
jgi:hypothetical protein